MTTTAGSLALRARSPPRDAHVAARLREAGAVILGKTNLTEWANFRSTRSISGWSGRGGQCRNPYALDRNPCGSSSGSGAAVAANLAPLAVGTETDGSIVCPADELRHRRHQADRRAGEPRRHHPDLAQPGHRRARWRARVADAAALLTALAGADPRDPATRRSRAARRRLHALPRPRRACAARASASRATWPASPRHRPALRGGDRRDEAARGRDRRPGGRAERQGARRPRVRGAALRVQGRPRGLPRRARARGRGARRSPT